MWDFLRPWVRQLVIIVVLAGFVDMLLPSGQMRKFAQVVVGLFIIMALVNPLLLLFRPNAAWRLPDVELDAAAWKGGGSPGGDAVLAATVEEQVFRHYQQRLEEQVETLILSLEGITRARARVAIESDSEHRNLGGIGGIKVWVGRGKGEKDEVKIVDKIEVRVDGENDGGRQDPGEERGGVPAEIRDKITALLTAFFALDPQSITIFALEGEGF